MSGVCRTEGATGTCTGLPDGGPDGSDGGRWSDPEGLNLAEGLSDLSVTKDGTELYMATSAGQVYVSMNTSGTFGMPMPVVEVNTGFASNPQISADGLTLYFSSPRSGSQGASDIWRVTRVTRGAPWTDMTNVAVLNSVDEETGGATTEDARLLVMTRFVAGRARLFASTYSISANSWIAPVPMTDINDAISNSSHACFDGEGTRMVFTSDRAGTYDIYIATRPDRASSFGPPVPIAEVNTADDEADPCLSTDGKTLYFARGPIAERRIFRSAYTP
jgi:Tol biopolymer transport system component